MCCTSDTGLPSPDGGGGLAVLVWGNENIGAAADTRFLSPGHDMGSAPTADIMQFVAPHAMTLKNLSVRHNSAAGNGNAVDYAVLINGVATVMVISLATGAVGNAQNLVNQIVVAVGDRISIRAVKAVNIGGGVIDTQVSITVDS